MSCDSRAGRSRSRPRQCPAAGRGLRVRGASGFRRHSGRRGPRRGPSQRPPGERISSRWCSPAPGFPWGGTPLYRCTRLAERIGLRHLYIKNEGANPTGVFKDRGSLVELTKAKEQGAKAVCVASTGNMAASVAAYASLAGLPCYVRARSCRRSDTG
ncbi:MAG: pyridoxal-phosphate dependent enzyme [Candidatus Rokubacteria bacterium]|nr:pyridoxal-phosphate dependent enzyme [Candidatus Rokubacteria bacterium]